MQNDTDETSSKFRPQAPSGASLCVVAMVLIFPLLYAAMFGIAGFLGAYQFWGNVPRSPAAVAEAAGIGAACGGAVALLYLLGTHARSVATPGLVICAWWRATFIAFCHGFLGLLLLALPCFFLFQKMDVTGVNGEDILLGAVLLPALLGAIVGVFATVGRAISAAEKNAAKLKGVERGRRDSKEWFNGVGSL